MVTGAPPRSHSQCPQAEVWEGKREATAWFQVQRPRHGAPSRLFILAPLYVPLTLCPGI